MIDLSRPQSDRVASDARQRLAALLRHADAPTLHPPAFAQQRMWFLEALEDHTIAYNEWRAVGLDGPVDEQALATAVRDLVATHAALRTTFVAHAGEALQVVAAVRDVPLEVIDLTNASDADVLTRIASEAWRPFDLATGPLFRACLARRGDDASILLLTWHHIVADGWSTRVMFEELSRSYSAAAGTPIGARAPGWQFADYVSAQREWLNGSAREVQLEYWRQRFATLPPVLRLPSDRPRPATRSSRGGSRRFHVSAETTAQARALARTHSTTLFTVLMTAWMTVLSRYSRETDIVVGAPVAGRTRPETEPLVGFFANTLAIRADIDGELPFAGALDRVRAATLGALAHQELPFDLIVDAVRPPRDLSQAPLFQTMLALQDDPVRALSLPAVTVCTFDVPASTAKFDLHWLFEEQADGGLAGWLQYSADLFDEATADRIVSHLLRLLDAAVRTPGVAVQALELMLDEERQQVVQTWNDTATPYPSETLVDVLEAQAARTPEATAVEFEGNAITYAAFTTQVRQVTTRLRALGARPGDRIGVCLERSVDLVVALHAAVRSGGAFVPLDPSYPNERLQWLANDARVAVLVTDANGLSRLGPLADTPLLLLGGDDDPRAVEGEPAGELPAIGPDDLAYLLYTSGSTGQPKGALNTHRGICNRLRWMQEYYPLSSRDAVLQKTPIGFDVSVWEFFWPLATGARLVVARPDGHRDPAYLTDVIANRSITTLHFVPSMLQMFLEAPDVERCTSLRQVICSGEALPADLVRRFMARTPAAIHNLYGPTEAAIDVTAWTCGPDSAMRSTIPLGRPVPNTSIYIVDGGLAPTPIGVPGELCIGGVQVARGYWNRPELTAERFVADPFSTEPGASMYRTGDLACWRPDGTLEFLGRLDHQIKIRGCRVEPGEIESALAAHPDVQDAVVMARRDEDDTRLVAYVIPRPVTGGAEIAGALEDWSGVFDEVYERGAGLDDDFSGWTSSYTGAPIPHAEMRLWADAAAATVLAQRPERVLEIGVGTGLLLSRIAPSCREYVGLDASRRGIERLRRALVDRPDLAHVRVEHGLAHDTAGLPAARFDAVVINSVAQYFPSFEYFVQVIGDAVRVTSPGGAIVLGDLRALPLLEAFHAAVQITRAEPETPVRVVRETVVRQIVQEKELLFDPGMFAELRRRIPGIGAVKVALKPGRGQNELTQFRFDAVLFIGAAPEVVAAPALDWTADALTIGTLAARLAASRDPHVLVRGIRNPRLVLGTATARILERAQDDSPVGAVRAAAAEEALRVAATLPDADDLRAVAATAGWQVDVGFDAASTTSMSAMFRRSGAPSWQGDAGWPTDAAPTRADECTSDPLFEARRRALVPALRRHCEQVLTSFMVPSSFVVLRRWPIGPTGKLDRRALPAPERQGTAAVRELPASDTAAGLAVLWQELLRVDGIGANDHFFELGGHSLLAMQLIGRVRRTFGVGLPLRVVFESPTLAALAGRIDSAVAEASGKRAEPVVAALPRADRGGQLPLSSGERRLWFLDAFQPGSFAYNVPARLRIAGPVDSPRLQAALDATVARHAALRTTYASVEGQPVRRVDAGRRIALRVVDLSRMPAGARDAEADRVYRDQALAPIALDGDALVRVVLVRHDATRHDLILVAHHIVCDGWSFGLLMRDLDAAYRGASIAAVAGAPEYADYAAWEAAWLRSPEAMQQLAYWRERLAGPLPVLQLPSDRPRPALQTFAGANESQQLPASLVGAIDAVCRERGLTPFMVTLAGFVALLHRYTGAEDVIVGTPVANRRHPDTASMVGFFVNTLPIRVAVTGDVTFDALMTRVRDAALAAFDHQELPFERLVEELQPERQLAYPPICQVMFAYQNARVPDLCLPDAAPARLEFPGGTAKFDLTVFAEPTEGGLTITAEYNVDLFRPSAMQRLLGHLATVIRAGLAAPESPVAHLPLLTPDERTRQLVTWNDTARPEHEPARIEALVAGRAAQTPHRMAVVHGSSQLTYAELTSRAAGVARAIARAGVARGDRVGIALPPSADWLVAVLAVLQAGGTYVPLDPAYPTARIETMARSAGLSAIVSARGVAAPQGPWARIDVDDTGFVGHESTELTLASEWDDRLYVIFTSGSTGGPKGATVTHRGFANLLRWYVDAFSFSDRDRVLLASSTSFDLTQKNLFAPFVCGGALHIPKSEFYDPDALVAQIRDEAITVINTTPSAFYPLVERAEATDYRSLASLRLVVLGGEPIATSRLDRWRRSQAFGARIVNSYGPTECTDICASHELTNDDFEGHTPVPIGRPIFNVTIAVLDACGEPCPLGVPGDLVIGGTGVGPGYINDAELTAARFAPSHLTEWPQTRLYRTGDCVRQRDDGAIEFLGRFDHQVKVRGFRVEIGEIEAAIAAHDDVSACAVVTDRGIRHTVAATRLVAFAVPHPGACLNASALRAFVAPTLPDYMVPSSIHLLDALPMTPNGKVDRLALTAIAARSTDAPAEVQAPVAGLEERVATIWREVLGLPRVGRHDNFFDIGGHSLLVVVVQLELRRVVDRDVAIVDLFRYPTVSSLAAYLAASGSAVSASAERASATERGRRQREAFARAGRPGGRS